MPTLVRRIDVAKGLSDISIPQGYYGMMALVTYNDTPLGDIWIGTYGSTITADYLATTIVNRFGNRLVEMIVEDKVLGVEKPEGKEHIPSISIVIPTSDRPEHLRKCLRSIADIVYPKKKVIVVDNGSDCEKTLEIASRYGAEYIREKKRGANFCRNKGIRSANSEIIAFTDDDVVVDSQWLDNIAKAFEADTGIACVTGLIMPLELETPAQEFFESYGDGGMRRGYETTIYNRFNLPLLSVGRIGVGGNMAFRSAVLEKIGGLDEALCPGTPAKCGEEADIFYRLMSKGYKICYEPRALVWHCHRREMDELCKQLGAYSTGAYSFLTKALIEYRDIGALSVAFSWFRNHHLKNVVFGLTGRGRQPWAFTVSELKGAICAPTAYLRSKFYVAKLRSNEGSERRGLKSHEKNNTADLFRAVVPRLARQRRQKNA